ncbi:MerR family transcriptional regulator [Paenibacillus sp. GCM10027627]|uniref:MerR family transcriptional regulator n=1 Tax=unclassified Paenibacillus TaxID=185978 RepID=UPI00364036B4
MLSIGQFSKICGVSAKTLRYYNEHGLLIPSETNVETGYRYYSIAQLKQMLVINRLKSYQFSLEEIKTLLELEEEQSDQVLYLALQHKRNELKAEMNALRQTLNQMNDDLADLNKGIPFMSYLDRIDVQLAEFGPFNILYVRQTMKKGDYAVGYGKYFRHLFEKIADQKFTPLGAPMTIYHHAEHQPNGNDTEFAVPVLENVKGTRELSATLCAKSILKGAYSDLASVYARIREWTEIEGYELAGSPFEVYLTNPDQIGNAEANVTEVYFPIKKK